MVASKKTAGVLGGMGPEATVDFLASIIALTPATCDQDHVPLIVDQNTQVPSRQAAFLGDAPDPGAELAKMGRRLEAAGADFLVMPCNLAHTFAAELEESVGIPLISIIDAAVGEVGQACDVVGIMAIDGTIAAGLYQAAVEAADMSCLIPDADELDRLKALVNLLKAGGDRNEVAAGMKEIAVALASRGANTVIAACTEIPLVLSSDDVGVPLVSSTDSLARKTVAISLGHEPLPGGREQGTTCS
ncbi:MAG: amino acid racemase [Woeseiaceae bacterium]|nr:amino acid racemase [Woeseiaceae bacterium]